MKIRLYACVCVAVAFAACDESPIAPTQKPQDGGLVARLTVSIDQLDSAVAIPWASVVRFDASQSVSGAQPLQYVIDFGDQVTTTESVAEHVYQAAGDYTASLTITDASGRRATTSQTVVVRAVEGSWFHFGYNQQSRRTEIRRLTLTSQKERVVTGEWVGPRGGPVSVSGEIDGERTLRVMAAGARLEGAVPSQVFGDGTALHLSGFVDTGGPSLPFTPILGSPTSAPPEARLHIQIDSAGSTVAIHRFSPIRFSADGSTGDSLQYVIEFGDGEFTASSSAVHPCSIASNGLVSVLTVVDRFGRLANASRRFQCENIGGDGIYAWSNTIRNPTTGIYERRTFHLRSQDGPALRGFYVHPGGERSQITGELTGERGIRLRLDGGGIEFAGELTLSDRLQLMCGLPGLVSRCMRVTPQGGSATGMMLEFAHYCHVSGC